MNRSKEGMDHRSIVGADFLGRRIGQAPTGQMSGWLAGRIRAAARDGRLRPGDRLPASRTLAADLGVSRGVVTEAYRRLLEDGVVVTRGPAGTVIAGTVVAGTVVAGAVVAGTVIPGTVIPGTDPGVRSGSGPVAASVARPIDRAPNGGAPNGRVPDGLIPGGPIPDGLIPDGLVPDGGVPGSGSTPAAGRRPAPPPGTGRPAVDPWAGSTSAFTFDPPAGVEVFTALRAQPARYDLSPGVPDLAAFPRAGWLRSERAVLGTLTASSLGYGDPAGARPFRRAVAAWLARYRGISADPDRIVVVAGVAQALALLCWVLARRGIGEIAVEDPGSRGARQQLADWGARTVPIPVDNEGLRVDRLAATGTPAVLVSPAHQFPMGVVLSGARRRELAAWADAGGLIIEDDYDAEHRYDRPPVDAIKAARPDGTCYAGSVSKILAPALRLGWLVPPDGLYDEVVAAKQQADLGSPVLAQLVLADLMESGRLEAHLRSVRRRHRLRRDAMIAALGRHLPAATVHGAAAGLHLTVSFDGPPDRGALDDRALAARALAAGVKVQPLSWHRVAPGPPGLVLGYAASPAGQLEDAIARLADVAGGRIG
ncbi:aminotransferase class I/II-fold pyridoxal phosphate-dependent enzyme [Nakamurella sp.]|uniref:aminotransferase-like domain-containing protein n=1 Tax=Nakamurella sp. TaxID=1869182 RepID=UPI003B3B2E04